MGRLIGQMRRDAEAESVRQQVRIATLEGRVAALEGLLAALVAKGQP